MINNLFYVFKLLFCKKFLLLNLLDINKELLFNFFNVLFLFFYKRLIYVFLRFLRCIFELR